MSRPVTQRKRLGVRKNYGNKSNVGKAEPEPRDDIKHKGYDQWYDGLKLTSVSPPTVNLLSPSLSFGSDVNEEVFDLIDKMDCGVISSTPLSTDRQKPADSAAPALVGFTPVKRSSSQRLPNVLYSREGMGNTPLTSQVSSFKRKSVSIVQTPHNKAIHALSHWGLPEKVLNLYADKGVREMFQWQAECLSMEGVLSGRNIIYSAPTSAGKTLVAELLLLKCILERRKKVVMILPFVSIVHEKVSYLQSLFESVGIKVGGFMGGHSPPGGLVSVDLAICTIEKANSLINRTLEEGKVDQLGMVIVDELHMIGDHHRGYLLELLLTKLRYVCQGYQLNKICHENKLLQILGMSATLPNLSTLAKWLNAVLYQTNFRPVPLQEMVKIGKNLYNYDFEVIQEIPGSEMATDDDEIAEICCKRVIDGHSVLIFCPTKAWCEKLATTLAVHQSFQQDTISLDHEGLNSVLEQLNRTQVGVDTVLAKTLKSGIAFHHAGLTFDEREIIEGGFRKLSIRVLVATSTLSSGVNLPARLVIVRTPIFHQRLLDIMMYKQMIGRAGRKGVDDKGESILVCKPAEKQKVITLLKADAKPVKSCLGRPHTVGMSHSDIVGSELAAIKRAVLEVIVNGTALLEQDIQHYLECTLLYTELLVNEGKSNSDAAILTNSLLQQTLSFLCDKDFSRERDSKEQSKQQSREFYPTQLGMATVASGLAPDEALIVFDEFSKARKAFVLENELHIIYLVTPVYILDQWPSIDWYKYYNIWEQLSEDMKHVANTVGVKESFIARAMQSRPPERTPQQVQRLRIHRRFFTSLALQDLVREVPVNTVSYKFSASKGLLQNLQSASGTFSGMVTVFCNKLGWTSLELLLSQFQSRLTFGIERELIDLVKVSLLNGSRARILFNAGYHNLAALATANPSEIEKILRNAFPYKTSSEDSLMVNWCTKFKRGMTEIEAAQEIIQEAKKMLCDELNIPEFVLNAAHYKSNPGKPIVSKEIVEENHSVRLNRKIMNKKQQQTTCEGMKQSKHKTDTSPSSSILGSVKQSVHSISTPPTLNTSSMSLQSPIPQVIDFNRPPELSESIQSMEGVGSNMSLDLFKDLDLSTLAQLDAICNDNEIDQVHKQLSTPEEPVPWVNGSKHESICITEEESLMANGSFKELSLLHSTTCSESGLTVIDVTANITLLQTFMDECKEQPFLAFSVATENVHSPSGIGNEIIKPLHMLKGIQIPMSNEQVVGVAFSWGDMDTYYVSLCESCDHSVATVTKHGLDMSLIGDCSPIPLEYRIKSLASLFSSKNHYVIGFNIKKQVKHLMSACHIDVTCMSRDPKVADWLFDPDNREKTLNHMILKYLPEQPKVVGSGEASEVSLSTMAIHSPFSYLRASAECVLAEMLMQSISKLLSADDFIHSFNTVEMPMAHVLAKMEVNGIGFSPANCESLREQLQCHLTELEQEAYVHAGRVFALTSPEDVSVVLFKELKLPSFQAIKSVGLGSSKRRIQHLSTSKDILERIRELHPLPGIVLEWRRVSSTMSRTLFPLVKASVAHTNLNSYRIHSSCQIHTATGRISFFDPNLQNVPNEYPVGLHRVSSSVQQSLLNSLLPEFDVCASQTEQGGVDRIKTVCMRDVFKPFPGGVFISADYSQLELRLLAHLSKDRKLCSFLNQSGDAFRMIAGEWLSKDPSCITDIQRQQTKQMCYGMIYGIGVKALAVQMGVTEEEAHQFIGSFKSKYPQVNEFITSTIADCRNKGYVLTIKGRKRFLSHINSTDVNKRAQAERQAINSTIQGSAADLVKVAMINVDRELQRTGMVTSLPWLQSEGVGHQTDIALLVLQLHDELVYEVHSSVVSKVAVIMKKEMENAITLNVPFPVKTKSGLSWGQLETISIP